MAAETGPKTAHLSSPRAAVTVTNSPGSIIAPSGGTNTVNNYGPPPAGVELVSGMQYIGKQDEATFQWACTFRVQGSPDNVLVSVLGTSLKEASINPIDQGMASTRESSADGARYLKIDSPKGRYQVVINTLSNNAPSVQLAVNQ